MAVDCPTVSPIGTTLPEAGALTIATPQLSVAATVKGTTAPAGPVASTTIGAGQAITGASRSPSGTANVQGAEAPRTEVGTQTAVTSSHKPLTCGANVTTAPHWPGSFATTCTAGH